MLLNITITKYLGIHAHYATWTALLIFLALFFILLPVPLSLGASQITCNTVVITV